MERPDLYSKTNMMAKNESKEFVKLFSSGFGKQLHDQSVLIDVGSGDGGTLLYVLEDFPVKFKEIVGLDVSEGMVKFAQDTYGSDVMRFHQLDINEMGLFSSATLNEKCGVTYEYADVVTSFFCFHFIQDLKKAFENIGRLVKPGGFFATNFLKDVNVMSESYEETSTKDKYVAFKKDTKHPCYPLKYVDDPLRVLNEILKEAKFEVKAIELKTKSYDFGSREIFSNLMRSAVTLPPNMPEELKNEFHKDFVDRIESSLSNTEGHFIMPYEYLYIIAIKK